MTRTSLLPCQPFEVLCFPHNAKEDIAIQNSTEDNEKSKIGFPSASTLLPSTSESCKKCRCKRAGNGPPLLRVSVYSRQTSFVLGSSFQHDLSNSTQARNPIPTASYAEILPRPDRSQEKYVLRSLFELSRRSIERASSVHTARGERWWA